MAFKVFAPGVLTSSDVNTFLMRQAVITCTSSTRPASPSEGMTIYETDTNLYQSYDGSNWIDLYSTLGGAWTSYTPTLSGSGWSYGTTTVTAAYAQIGKLIVAVGDITIGTSVSSGAGRARMTLPVASSSNVTLNLGQLHLLDTSLGKEYPGSLGKNTDSGTQYAIFNMFGTEGSPLIANISGFTSSTISAGLTVPLSSGDRWSFTMTYEAA